MFEVDPQKWVSLVLTIIIKMKTEKKEKERKEEIETILLMTSYFKEQRDFCNEMIKEGEKQLTKLMKKKKQNDKNKK